MLTNLRLSAFKRFAEVELPLSPFVVLMGENGSGKTTLLQSIALALRIRESTDILTVDDATGKVTPRRKGVPYTHLPGLFVEDPKDIFHSKRTRTKVGPRPIRIELTDQHGNTYRLDITTLFGAYNAKGSWHPSKPDSDPVVLRHRSLFVSGFVGIQASEERFFPLAIEDRLARGRASEVLRNLLLEVLLADPEKFDRMKKKISDHFSFEIGDVEFDDQKDINVHANYKERFGKRGLKLDLSSAGSGFLQVLQILAPIYRYSSEKNVVLLDEPDAHLHPNLQRTVARVLQEIAEEESLQIIVSTHSTAIIREVRPEAVIPVSSGKKHLAPLATTDEVESEIELRLDNFTAGKASIAGAILFVEDTDLSILERVDSLTDTELFEGPHTLPVLPASGKDDKVPFRMKSTLQDVTQTEVRVFFLRDGDGLTEEWREKLSDYARSNDVELLILERHEVENYLLNPPLIARVLIFSGSEVTDEEVRRLMEEVMRNVISRARHGFDRTLRDNLYKTGRLMNEEFSFGDAEKEAAKIRSQYEELETFDDLVRVVPGKEALKEVLKELKERYGTQVTAKGLLRAMEQNDVSDELLLKLRQVRKKGAED